MLCSLVIDVGTLGVGEWSNHGLVIYNTGTPCMQRTQCTVLYFSTFLDPIFGPFARVCCFIIGFCSFLCIQDVTYLNCHLFSPIFTHLYPIFVWPFDVSLCKGRWGTLVWTRDMAGVKLPH